MKIKQTILRSPKKYQVTFEVQCYCLPSKFQLRKTGWMGFWDAEYSTQAEAREDASKRLQVTTRWNGVRIVKNVYDSGAVITTPMEVRA